MVIGEGRRSHGRDIRDPEGRVFIIEVWFFATVQEMKEMIQKFHGFPVARQRLVFEGRVLEDHHTQSTTASSRTPESSFPRDAAGVQR
ncbi:unnamed protein product [Spirodela intermedia]|uniref:Ubiquitin-like domain-containing protein n=1 Tax=Spirodela intermedia TaxID=51605 RepID=A0A7I8JQ82_SPIIN|nr:unnamed protein product [Spirodela intermedia]CAA6671921.1 unnamed protein product [Spirodela intermedia]